MAPALAAGSASLQARRMSRLDAGPSWDERGRAQLSCPIQTHCSRIPAAVLGEYCWAGRHVQAGFKT